MAIKAAQVLYEGQDPLSLHVGYWKKHHKGNVKLWGDIPSTPISWPEKKGGTEQMVYLDEIYNFTCAVADPRSSLHSDGSFEN